MHCFSLFFPLFPLFNSLFPLYPFIFPVFISFFPLFFYKFSLFIHYSSLINHHFSLSSLIIPFFTSFFPFFSSFFPIFLLFSPFFFFFLLFFFLFPLFSFPLFHFFAPPCPPLEKPRGGQCPQCPPPLSVPGRIPCDDCCRTTSSRTAPTSGCSSPPIVDVLKVVAVYYSFFPALRRNFPQQPLHR